MTSRGDAPDSQLPFAGECRFWVPRYRLRIVALVILVSIGIWLTWQSMRLMAELIITLKDSGGAHSLIWLISAFSAAMLAKVGTDYLQILLRDRMNAGAMIDLEREVLESLFRQDSAFYARHALQEIVSRLIRDVIRVIDRRAQVLVIVAALAELGIVLAFFLQEEWTFALGLALCAAVSLVWVMRTTTRFTQVSEELFSLDEENSILLEQLLRATPEMQLARATQRAQASFGPLRLARLDSLYLRGRMKAARLSTFPLIEALTLAGVLLLAWLGSGTIAIVALLPVLIQKIPTVFGKTGEITEAISRLQLANAGAKRLEAYHCPEWRTRKNPVFPTIGEVGALEIEQLTKRYQDASGRLQGGVAEVSATVPSGSLCVIAGGSGSGKSTLVNVILGALEAQQGRVELGGSDWLGAEPEERARRLAYLPQRPVLIQGSIAANVLLVSEYEQIDQLPTELAHWIERCGLATICRHKALEQSPSPEGMSAELVAEVHQALSKTGSSAQSATDPAAFTTPLGQWRRTEAYRPELLRQLARKVLAASRRLLELPDYAGFSALSPQPLNQTDWQLRRQALESADDSLMDRVAATLVPTEISRLRARSEAATRDLLEADFGLQAPAARPWHQQENWREALLAGLPAPRSTSEKRQQQDALQHLIAESPELRQALTRLGLEQEVGVSGSALSGGQAQIVGLARALLRGAGLVVLDEPSSALDPVRSRLVRDCLLDYRRGRIVLVVSHDPILVAAADQVLLLDRGSLVDQGSPAKLAARSPLFRQLYPEIAAPPQPDEPA